MNEEYTMTRDRVECLVRELTNAIKHDSVFQVKIRFNKDGIVIIPHCAAIEIKI